MRAVRFVPFPAAARWWSAVTGLVIAALVRAGAAADDDPNLWLEDIDGAKALAWVQEHNEKTNQWLTRSAEFDHLRADALAVLNSASRIPDVELKGNWIYELWRDGDHPRGVFRRASPAEFHQPQPRWETVLDIDALGK